MKDNMKLPVTEKNEENELSSQQQFGKSKEAKKARKKFKAMQAEKARQKAKENDCFSKISLNVGGLEKVPLDMSDKENVVSCTSAVRFGWLVGWLVGLVVVEKLLSLLFFRFMVFIRPFFFYRSFLKQNG